MARGGLLVGNTSPLWPASLLASWALIVIMSHAKVKRGHGAPSVSPRILTWPSLKRNWLQSMPCRFGVMAYCFDDALVCGKALFIFHKGGTLRHCLIKNLKPSASQHDLPKFSPVRKRERALRCSNVCKKYYICEAKVAAKKKGKLQAASAAPNYTKYRCSNSSFPEYGSSLLAMVCSLKALLMLMLGKVLPTSAEACC